MHSLRVEHRIWRLSILAGLTIATLWGQESLSRTSANAQVVRVRVGDSCGWCTEGYNEVETTVEPQRIVIANRSYSDKKKYPDQITEYKITKRDWEDLQRLIDTKVLPAFANPPTGCPGCADEPITWIELQVSDGEKKSIAYNEGADPGPIVELRQKITAIETKAFLKGTRHPPQE